MEGKILLSVLVSFCTSLGMFIGQFDVTTSVVTSCRENGYYQNGQIRVICSVEEKK